MRGSSNLGCPADDSETQQYCTRTCGRAMQPTERYTHPRKSYLRTSFSGSRGHGMLVPLLHAARSPILRLHFLPRLEAVDAQSGTTIAGRV